MRLSPVQRLVVALGLAAATTVTEPPTVHTQDAAQYVAGEVIIEFEPDATTEDRADARTWVRAARRELLRRRRNATGDIEVAQIPERYVERAIAALRRHPAVRRAEPNWIYQSLETSNDFRFLIGDLWGMYSEQGAPMINQFGSQAREAWDAGNIGNRSIAIGVIDEGIQITHPDLAANIWRNPVEFAGQPGVDDDGNGYIDDLNGWDFFNNNNSVFDGIVDDHGTHVAGTIGGVGGNGVGVAGVNWHVTLIPAKFIGPAGSGSAAHAIKALDYITDLKTRHGLNIVATNNSWGGPVGDQMLLDAIVRSARANILFIAAAGNFNNNNDAVPFYPASYNTTAGAGYDSVIAVANITITGAKAGLSSYGLTTVDLGAPGSDIWSTVPGTVPVSNYARSSGTSMATAHVSGAAALYASLLPAVSARRIKEVILASATATPTPSLNGLTATGGRLNIGEFAAAAPTAPAAPTALDAAATAPSQITLTWQDTATNEDGHQIERCEGAACTNFMIVTWVDADATSFEDQVPSSGVTYRYRVAAYNRGGYSYSNVAEPTTIATAVLVARAGIDATVDEGQLVTLDGTGSVHPGNEPLTFAWTQIAGTGVLLNGADSSQPTFTAPAVGPGGETLTFSLTVTAGEQTATDTVAINVLNVNAQPIITSAAPLTATEDVLYSYGATATDEDGPGQIWSVLADDQSCGGTIDASGLYRFMPMGPAPPASCVVAIQVCDGGSPEACATETTTVTIAAVNDEPSITSTAPATATEGVPYTYAAAAADEDGPGQAWSLLPANSCGGTIDPASGVFTFTPAGPAPPANCVVAIQFCDTGAPNACASQETTVTIALINDPPAITSAAPAMATEDVPYLYGATASDGDGPGQSWKFLLPAHTCGGSVDAASGVFTFTPDGPTPVSSCVVVLEVCDGGEPNACAAQETTITINAVNDAPAITSAAPGMATEDLTYSYAATAADADGTGQIWKLLPAHSCAGNLAANGLFTFMPAGPTPPAACVVSLEVCDEGGACAAQTTTVAIAAVNDGPTFAPPANVSAVATNGDGATVSFAANGSDPEEGTLAAICTPASGSVFPIGDTTVGCTVTDSAGATATGSLIVTVTDVAVPGEMRGDGFIRDDDAKYFFEFWAKEWKQKVWRRDADMIERARLSIRIDEDGRKSKKGRTKRDDRFESRSVDFISFSDDPTIRPGHSHRPQVDTVLFSGVGEWNGHRGYRYEVFAQDSHDERRHRESIRVTIWDSNGAVVASFDGELDGGSIRSVRIRH